MGHETEAILEAGRMAVRRATLDSLLTIIVVMFFLFLAARCFHLMIQIGRAGGRDRKRKYVWRTKL